MNSTKEALILISAMGAVILFCRAFPFLFLAGAKNKSSPMKEAFLNFVEKIVPPAAMTVLAFNALGSAFGVPAEGFMALIAAVFTALVHLWKRNALLSIIGGTVLYMIISL